MEPRCCAVLPGPVILVPVAVATSQTCNHANVPEEDDHEERHSARESRSTGVGGETHQDGRAAGAGPAFDGQPLKQEAR